VKAKWIVMWTLLLATVWGLAEIFGKDLLRDLGLGGWSLWVAATAVLALSLGRGLWNRPGSSSLIGLLAACFRFAEPGVTVCHLLGIAAYGLMFDLFATTLLGRKPVVWWRAVLVGPLAVYGARAFFALYITHVARYERWVEGGWPMIRHHIFGSGTTIAAVAVVLVPLGLWLGARLARPSAAPAVSPAAAPSPASGE
jgi:hypothetical protein